MLKKRFILPLLLCLLLVCLPTAVFADSTPTRELATVTPVEDEETDFGSTNTDSAADEDVNGTDQTDPAEAETPEQPADSDDSTVNNTEPLPQPELPQSLAMQFYDAATGKMQNQTVTPVSLSLNGQYLVSDVPAAAVSGRTLVPVRIISESLNAAVDWHKEDNTVTITLNDQTIILTIGQSTALVNGQTVNVPDNVSVALANYNGAARTMVPIRFVSENLAATVNYDAALRNVDIIPPVIPDDDTETAAPPGLDADGNMYRRVIIDAGHGGDDPGTNGSGYEEKEITLAVALKVEALLLDDDFEVIMSRTDDTYIALTDRAALTEEYDAPVFVSIHCNAAENIPTANGIETYAAPDDTDDAELAGCLQKQLIAATAAKDRGVKTSKLVVLTHNPAPAALVEIGFMTNADECAKITDEAYQDTLAAAIAAGINDYFAAK